MSKTRTTLYLTEEFHKNLKEICSREGISMGKKVEYLCRSYVETHASGNPQTMLDYAEHPKTLPLYRTCKHSKKALHRGEFFCNEDSYWHPPTICDGCDHYQMEKKKE